CSAPIVHFLTAGRVIVSGRGQAGGAVRKRERGTSMAQPLRIDGETAFFPIIGHPIGQVKSPASLSQIMADRGHNGMVVPIHVLPEDLPGWLAQAAAVQNCPGIVVTVPHKAPCLAFCSRVTARARAAGAVNIMLRRDGGWIGDATDG